MQEMELHVVHLGTLSSTVQYFFTKVLSLTWRISHAFPQEVPQIEIVCTFSYVQSFKNNTTTGVFLFLFPCVASFGCLWDMCLNTRLKHVGNADLL